MSWSEHIDNLAESEPYFASSSNGKSADSESVNEGSSPSEASRIFTREWLNPDEGMAYISLSIQPASKPGRWHYPSLEIADCSRRINLEFDYETEEQRQDRIYKLNVIRSQLTILEAYLHDNPGRVENKS